MDALAAYGSDSSSSSDDDAPPPPPAKKNHSTSKEVNDVDANNAETKKRRLNDTGNTDTDGDGLPPPIIAITGNASMSLWETDFLSKKKMIAYDFSTNNKSIISSEPLAKAIQNEFQKQQQEHNHATHQHDNNSNNNKPPTITNFASLLKTRHEFHNPRFLSNVAHQCGINTMLGSNMETKEVFEDYEYRLLELEEKARVQAFQDNQASSTGTTHPASSSSLFVQNQLEQALQKECHNR